jgi:hypothetical protein
MLSNPGGPRSWIAASFRPATGWRRALLWGSLLTALGVLLCLVPLFNVLGFEFSFAISPLAALAAADLGAASVRRLRATPGSDLEGGLLGTGVTPQWLLLALSGQVAILCAALLFPCLLAISVNAIRVPNCDWWFGIETFVLMPMLSATLAGGLGVAVGVIAGRRRWLSLLLPPLALFAVVLTAVWQFYAAPAVYSYNLLTGFFPGNLYDEQVELTAPFFWARLFQLCWVLALLLAVSASADIRTLTLAYPRPSLFARRRSVALLAVLFALAATALFSASGRLGFFISADEIAAELGAHFQTEHFDIYYAAGSPIEKHIESIAEEHEFRLYQVARALGVEPPAHITSYYFKDPQAKYRAMGARYVFMAKPWRKEIYLNHQDFPHDVLRHELVHVVAGEFGDPIFGTSVGDWYGLPVRFNVGMIEGLAVAIDWPDHYNKPLTPHQSVKAMMELGYAPPIDSLFSPAFFGNATSRSYTVAGSFLRWLFDRYGAEPLRQLYRNGGDFENAYHIDREQLFSGWKDTIASTKVPTGAAEMVRERFRRTSIFQRACPHAVARWRAEVEDLVAEHRLDEAIALSRRICVAVPQEPSYELELGNLLSTSDEVEEAGRIYLGLAGEVEEVSTTVRAEALVAVSSLAAKRGDWEETVRLLDEAAGLALDDNSMRNVVARRYAALCTWPSGPALRHYFWGEEPVTPGGRIGRIAAALAADPESGLAHYLLGRNLINEAPPADAAAALSRALELGLPHPLLRSETARQLAAQAYQAGDFAAVERAARLLMEPEQGAVLQLLGADWLDRLQWRRERGDASHERTPYGSFDARGSRGN